MFVLRSRLIQSASAAASPFALVLLAVLSLAPGDLRPHTGFGGHTEHFFAYFLTTLPIGIAWSARRVRVLTTLGLSVAAGAFELLQNFSPGRGPALSDWLVSTSGALAGMATISLLLATVFRSDLAPSRA